MVIAWAITYTAIAKGVKSGIERASKIMMPILFLMVIFLIGRMIFLPGALDGVNYMFEPDFSKNLGCESMGSGIWSDLFYAKYRLRHHASLL